MKVVDGVAALGFGGLKPVSRRTLAKYNRRRCVEAGYPWDGKFTTKAQIDEYFSGDKITCLLCGRAMRRLSIHVSKIHSVSEDDYRERFGLPWRRGLTSADSHDAYANASKERADSAMLSENLERARAVMRQRPPKHRARTPAANQAAIERITKKPVSQIFTGADADELLRRIGAGRTPQEIYKDPDMPGQSWWCGYRRRNPEYEQRLVALLDAMPFDFQARCQRLGKRFETELRKLFDQGLSDKQAGELLGVTAMTCNRLTKHWRKGAMNG